VDVLNQAKQLPNTRGGWNVFDGLTHLIKENDNFSDVIGRHGVPEIYDVSVTKEVLDNIAYIPAPTETTHFHSLLKTIIYQQLSGKSAEPIFNRLTGTLIGAAAAESGALIEPHHILSAKIDIINVDGKRKITVNGSVSGLSESKSKYMVSLAEHFSDETKLKGVDLSTLTDEELFDKLVAVKGLGPWSVHMFMMFNLQRANVLAPGDLGIRRGLSVFLGHAPTYFETKSKQNEIPTVCAGWAPYSSLGCWYMWRLSEDYQKQNASGGKKGTKAGKVKEVEE
jgi:DNA-3-methyladenine glycosylase II